MQFLKLVTHFSTLKYPMILNYPHMLATERSNLTENRAPELLVTFGFN